MKKKLGKFFIENNTNKAEIVYKVYLPSESGDYYSFVRNCCKEGLHQVIITSEIMIDIIKYYFIERKFTISNIEFMEEDEELNDATNNLLLMLDKDRAYINSLLEKLEFVSDKSSIDIKRVEFKGADLIDNKKFNMFIQVNGIFGIDEYNFDSEVIKLIAAVEKGLIYE